MRDAVIVNGKWIDEHLPKLSIISCTVTRDNSHSGYASIIWIFSFPAE